MTIHGYADRKVLLGYPSSERTDYRFTDALIQMINASAPIVELQKVNVVGSRIAVNRNEIVEFARISNCTDILWMDDDSHFPINGLIRLLRHDKDIVCAATCARDGSDRGLICVPLSGPIPYGEKLAQLERVGMPFMLTKMRVFDRLRKPYFAEPPQWMAKQFMALPDYFVDDRVIGEDTYFCAAARAAGFEIWCDIELSLELGHIGTKVYYPEQPNIGGAKVDETI